MANHWKRVINRGVSNALVLTLALAGFTLTGCGGSGGSDPIDVDENEVVQATVAVPLLNAAPRVIGIFSDADATVRGGTDILGSIVAPPPGTAPFDTPELLSINNAAVVESGGLLNFTIVWNDLGSDIQDIVIELRCQNNLAVAPLHTVIPALELFGLPSGTTSFTARLDPLNRDGGYELVVAYRDAQGNLSSIIRTAFLQTILASDPATSALTTGLRATGGETPPQLGPTQVWFPSGGVVEDTVPDNLEGAFPPRVSGDISVTVQQELGLNQIGILDSDQSIPRLGVIYGNAFDFVYLFCVQSESIDGDCASAFATIGVGRVIQEMREGKLEKRLDINEVKALIGSFDPNTGQTILDSPYTPGMTCPVGAFPLLLTNEQLAYVR